jgi:hypothetical protein
MKWNQTAPLQQQGCDNGAVSAPLHQSTVATEQQRWPIPVTAAQPDCSTPAVSAPPPRSLDDFRKLRAGTAPKEPQDLPMKEVYYGE